MKIIKIIKEKDGNSILLVILAFLVFFLGILVILINFMEFKITGLYVYDCAESALDNYTAENSVLWSSSIKNGTDFANTITQEDYEKYFLIALGAESFSATRRGERAFEITNISINYLDYETLNFSVSFTLTMPLSFAGQQVSELNKDMIVYSHFNFID